MKMGIFSLVPRVVPPVTSQLTNAFSLHFVWFTNWSGQTFCKKWVEWIRHELLDYPNLVRFTEKLRNKNLHFLCSETSQDRRKIYEAKEVQCLEQWRNVHNETISAPFPIEHVITSSDTKNKEWHTREWIW